MMIRLTELTNTGENPVLVNVDRICVVGAGSDGRTVVLFDGGLLPVKETLEQIASAVAHAARA